MKQWRQPSLISQPSTGSVWSPFTRAFCLAQPVIRNEPSCSTVWLGAWTSTPIVECGSRLKPDGETAETLLGVLHELDRPTLGVNFDPANMILYAKGIRSSPSGRWRPMSCRSM